MTDTFTARIFLGSLKANRHRSLGLPPTQATMNMASANGLLSSVLPPTFSVLVGHQLRKCVARSELTRPVYPLPTCRGGLDLTVRVIPLLILEQRPELSYPLCPVSRKKWRGTGLPRTSRSSRARRY